jgi:phosphoglycerate dehydrogenase-like enzyme
MKILFLFKPAGYWEEQFIKLKEEFPDEEFIVINEPDKRIMGLQHADAVVTGRLTKDEVRSSKNLKAVIVPFTGLNNFPLKVLKERNIAIFNTHANAPFVAERAVSLALALLGRVVEFHNDMSKGVWNRSHDNDDLWTSIRNRTCGILGYGNIGKHIAEYLKPFGCRIIGLKRNAVKEIHDPADEVSSNLDHVVSSSSIIFNVLPLSPETKEFINSSNIEKFKGKYIISVGRGETISEEALYNALKDNIVAGAALDVWYKYPGKNPEPVEPANLPFWKLKNVVMSPHCASHTKEAVNSMIEDTCNNIKSFLKLNIKK